MIDISDEVELKNGKANPFGWSQSEIHYENKIIGFLECGAIHITDDKYSCKEVQEDAKTTRGYIYKNEVSDEKK